VPVTAFSKAGWSEYGPAACDDQVVRPKRLVWTVSAEDRLTGGYPGNRVVARAFVVVLFLFIWLCFVALALLVPDTALSWALVAVVTLGFGLGGATAAALGGRGGQRRRIARLRTELPNAVLIACTPVDGMPWAVRQVARATGKGAGPPFLIIASYVVAVESERISFLSGRRSMVIPTADLDRIQRGTATIQRGWLAPSAVRPTIDLGFTVADDEPIVVQLCPIPINQEPVHYFRPFELGAIAQTIDLAIRGARLEDHVEM
jgi:hypothetical protein